MPERQYEFRTRLMPKLRVEISYTVRAGADT